MGKRLLRAWMLRPSIDAGEINQRLDAVEGMVRESGRARGAAPLDGRHPRPGAAAEPRYAGDGKSARPARAWRVTGQAARRCEPHCLTPPASRSPASAARSNATNLAICATRIVSSLEDEPPLTLADGGVIRVGRRRRPRRAARPQPQQQAVHCADRAARAPAHRHRLAEGQVQQRLRLLPGNLEGQPAPCARRLRAQANAGQRRALHHARAEGIRGQGAGCAGEDGRDRAASVRRTALRHRRRGAPHSPDRAGAGGNRRAGRFRCTGGESKLLPSGSSTTMRDIEIVEGRHPVIEQMEIAGVADRFVPNDLFSTAPRTPFCSSPARTWAASPPICGRRR